MKSSSDLGAAPFRRPRSARRAGRTAHFPRLHRAGRRRDRGGEFARPFARRRPGARRSGDSRRRRVVFADSSRADARGARFSAGARNPLHRRKPSRDGAQRRGRRDARRFEGGRRFLAAPRRRGAGSAAGAPGGAGRAGRALRRPRRRCAAGSTRPENRRSRSTSARCISRSAPVSFPSRTGSEPASGSARGC